MTVELTGKATRIGPQEGDHPYLGPAVVDARWMADE